jgi:hypothetical protein
MAYIGKTPTIGNFQVCDAISVVNGQAAYTMQVGGVNVSPESANHMIVSLNGVIQKPTDAYTVSSSTITFASNLVTGDVIDFIQILGNVLDLGVPSDNTVSLAKLTATGTKDATTFLRGDNTFDVPPLGGITEADQWRLSADHSGVGTLTSNWERVDTYSYDKLGTGMSQSSGIFTFPSTGIWRIDFYASVYISGASSLYTRADIDHTENNGASYNSASISYISNPDGGIGNISIFSIFDVTSVSTHKVRFELGQNQAGTPVFTGASTQTRTSAMFTRLGDT